jgi:hypothetical protein
MLIIECQRPEGRSSQSPGLETNADGSVNIYFGPRQNFLCARVGLEGFATLNADSVCDQFRTNW